MTDSTQHIEELLPEFLNETLEPEEQRRVEQHLQHCTACRTEVREWQAISNVTAAWYSALPEPSGDVLSRVKAEAGVACAHHARLDSPAPSFNLGYLWQLIIGQIPLVHRGIWVAAPLTIAMGLVVAFIVNHPERSAMPIALIAPFLAAVSLSLIYGPENDPSLELAMSTPTSPRVVMISRMLIVFTYDLLVSLVATLVIVIAIGGAGLLPLISMWIGPMLFLSAFALLTALRFGTQVAIMTSLALWIARVFALSENRFNDGATSTTFENIDSFWQSSPLLIALFICMMFVMIISFPRQEKFA